MEQVFSQIQQNEICKLYKNNVEIETIMKQFNSDERSIRKILKERELDRHYNFWSNELYDRGIKLYQSGKTLNAIANDLLVTARGLSKALKKKGITTRTASEVNRVFKRNSKYFDNIDTPNKSYILGLIYADGNNYVWGNKHCLTLCLQDRDVELLERVRQELEYEGALRLNPLHDKNSQHRNQYILAINDEYMCNQLKRIGVVERKSLVLQFPTFLRPDLIRHFVRGYFDGDGTLGYNAKTDKEMAGIAGTYEFCTAVSDILHAMFVKNYIYKPKQTKTSNTYELRTTGNLSSYKFLSWMYRDCDMKMMRKYQLYQEFCERYVNPKGRIKSL